MSANAENSKVEQKEYKKHKLNDAWVLWYDYQEKKYNSNLNWSDNLQILGEIGDVETLWGIYEKIGNVQDLQMSSNLHFFRKGIKPMWEDSKNMNGGKWVLEIQIDQMNNSIWADTLMFCASEICMLKDMPAPEDKMKKVITETDLDRKMEGVVCGAVLSPRRHYFRISIWTSCKDARAKAVGQMWKKFLDIKDSSKISFRAHETAIKSSRDVPTDMYTL